jgi:transposase
MSFVKSQSITGGSISDALDKYFKSVRPEIRLLIKNKTDEIINRSANDKSCNEKADNESESISVIPEVEKINTDQRIDTFNKVKELQAE